MGKTRRHKMRPTASNPLGVGNLKDLEANFLFGEDSDPAGPVVAIRDQLLNANVEEKLNGLQSLAVLSGSKEKVAAICSGDIVRIAAPLLCEKDESVRNAAAGALRNLSVCGPDICEYLVNEDVLTPLLSLLTEYFQEMQWAPTFDSSLNGQIDLRSDVFLQGINLLWNLCESTTLALDIFNQTQLLEGLMRCLDYKVFGMDIAISVAQCLLVVSENNPKSWKTLNENVNTFLSLFGISGDHGQRFLRTLSAGILSNVPALGSAYAPTILKDLAQILETDHQLALSSLPLKDREHKTPELDLNMDTSEDETDEAAALRRRRQDLPTKADLVVRDVGYLLDAQRVAAEIITNLCETDEEEWIDADTDEVSDSEIILDNVMPDKGSSTDLNNGDRMPIDVLEVIKSTGLIHKLWKTAQPIPDNVVQDIRATSKSLLLKAKNLRISSLLCLQNLCNSLNLEELGGAYEIYQVWVDLGQQVLKSRQDYSILEPSTSLMRSALEHLKSNKELFSQMTSGDLELILNGLQSCSMPEIRANWLRMLGTLGCLLPAPLAKVIISFIVETCAKEEDIWTISEAVDALMDMFSDDDWNQVIIDLNLPVLIKDLEKIFKTKMHQQKKGLKERFPAVQTVRTNLSRFVKYIEDESTKFVSNGNDAH